MTRIKYVVAALALSILAFEVVRQAGKERVPIALRESIPSPFSVPPTERSKESWFTDVSDAVHLDFVQAVGPFGTHFMPEINGSGGALFDCDRDGDLDLFLVNLGKSPKVSRDFPPDVNLSHRLYQQQANGVFSDETKSFGLSKTSSSLGKTQLGNGCAIGDVNNDGFPDIYITNYGPDQLYMNQAGTQFVDVTTASGLGCADWGTAAAFFDYDRDGWLDLIVVNYCADPRYDHSIACGFTKSTVSYCGPQKFETTIDRLYRNEGAASMQDGAPKFTDVTDASGFGAKSTYGLGLAIGDFDGNKWPDVFIANDMGENRLWMNQGNGTFLEEAMERGVALNGDGVKQGCMGVACADFDHDSDFDLLVTNLVTEGATLYENAGNGFFVDKSQSADLFRLTRRHTGWGVAWVDLDLDGTLDLPMVNGFVVPDGSMFPPHGEDTFQNKVVEVANDEGFLKRYHDKNQLLLGNAKGTYSDQSNFAVEFTRSANSTRGLIFGDVDQDGDIDLITTAIGDRARMYRNELPRHGHWLKVDCRLPVSGRDAIGATVRIRTDKGSWTSQIAPSTSFLSSNEPCIHFGLGNVERIERIEVDWPDGTSEIFPGVLVDQRVSLIQGTSASNSNH